MKPKTVPCEMPLQCSQVAKLQILPSFLVASAYEERGRNTVPAQNRSNDFSVISITVVERHRDARLTVPRRFGHTARKWNHLETPFQKCHMFLQSPGINAITILIWDAVIE